MTVHDGNAIVNEIFNFKAHHPGDHVHQNIHGVQIEGSLATAGNTKITIITDNTLVVTFRSLSSTTDLYGDANFKGINLARLSGHSSKQITHSRAPTTIGNGPQHEYDMPAANNNNNNNNNNNTTNRSHIPNDLKPAKKQTKHTLHHGHPNSIFDTLMEYPESMPILVMIGIVIIIFICLLRGR
jgi:hypothetical protein